jgi:hypothetical protein
MMLGLYLKVALFIHFIIHGHALVMPPFVILQVQNISSTRLKNYRRKTMEMIRNA